MRRGATLRDASLKDEGLTDYTSSRPPGIWLVLHYERRSQYVQRCSPYVAYLIRCGTCNYRAAHVTRTAAADAALEHHDETQHAGIEIEDALSPEGRGNGGGAKAK